MSVSYVIVALECIAAREPVTSRQYDLLYLLYQLMWWVKGRSFSSQTSCYCMQHATKTDFSSILIMELLLKEPAEIDNLFTILLGNDSHTFALQGF